MIRAIDGWMPIADLLLPFADSRHGNRGDVVMKPVRVRTIAGSTLALLVVAGVQLLGPASAQATTMKEHSLGTGNGYHHHRRPSDR